jgi:hypothetical protein
MLYQSSVKLITKEQAAICPILYTIRAGFLIFYNYSVCLCFTLDYSVKYHTDGDSRQGHAAAESDIPTAL